jgi:hypothetical protein
MMPPMFGQPWRQAMQMPQQFQGGMMPTRGPGGGWQMPPQMAMAQPQAQAPMAPAPMMGQQPQSFSPQIAEFLKNNQGFGGWGGM